MVTFQFSSVLARYNICDWIYFSYIFIWTMSVEIVFMSMFMHMHISLNIPFDTVQRAVKQISINKLLAISLR